MIGIFKPNRKHLPIESKAIYTLCYCSLCKACHFKFGKKYTIFLSHEITQLLISILKYIPHEIKKTNCHFFCNLKSKQILKHKIFDLAAEVSLILVWFKILDSQVDKEKNIYRLLSVLLKSQIQNIYLNLPDSLIMKIKEYEDIIRVNNNLIIINNHTSDIAKELFGYILNSIQLPAELNKELLRIAGNYGSIISDGDFLIDFNKDKKDAKGIANNEIDYNQSKKRLNYKIEETKKIIESLCNTHEINNYFKTCYYSSCQELYNKIEISKPIFKLAK